MDALIFDFDGVIADSEPIHFEGFRRVLAETGIDLSWDLYCRKYLGYDDRDGFRIMSEDQNRPVPQEQLSILIEKKTRIVQQLLRENVQPLPGVLALIRSAQEQKIPLAISSGALMNEIRLASQCIGVWEAFTVAVSAEDVAHSKPDPESYRKALALLSEKIGRSINPAKSFAIEDSPAGIASARGAGLNVLAVTSSYPAEELQKAQRVVTSLEKITPADLDAMLK